VNDIEDIYQLSPMQQGILFQTLYSPESVAYIIQASCTLDGSLNLTAFEQAWQQALERHTILRTSFYWKGLEKPMQVVRRKVNLPLEKLDWRGVSPSAVASKLEEYQQAEQRRGFNLDEPPLFRLSLIQTEEKKHHFIWTFNHILLEGWSASLILKEVFAIYRALCRSEHIRLEPGRPYRDFIIWLQQQDPSEAESYWRRALKGFTEPTPLGLDRVQSDLHPEAQAFAEQKIKLSATTTSALASLAKQHRLTLSTIVQGAWALLLSFYSGREHVLFGTVVSGRQSSLAGAESMVGLLINTLPTRVRIAFTDPILVWLKRLQEQQFEMLQFEHTALQDAQAWSELGPGTPLFESLFAFENWSGDYEAPNEDEDLQIRDFRYVDNRVNYPLSLLAAPGPGLTLKAVYDLRRFEPHSISKMLDHLRQLLENIVECPQKPISEIVILTPAERQQLLLEWNDTPGAQFASPLFLECFQAQVAQRPDALAVSAAAGALTYAALDARANQLARYLRRLGLGAEVCIALYLPRTPDLVVALVGVLKAGAAVLLLDAGLPARRLGFLLDDAGVPLLLTQQAWVERVPNDTTASLLCLDSDWESIAGESSVPLVEETVLTAQQLAYVVYTSGSSGEPKGVGVEHRALANLMSWHWQAYEVSAEDRATQVVGLSFDAALWEFCPHLATGASLHLVDEGDRGAPDRLREWLWREAITISILPTPLAEAVMDGGWRSGLALRRLLTGGDRLHGGPPAGSSFEFYNNYGPTENAVVTSWMRIEAEEKAAAGSNGAGPVKRGRIPAIGRPVNNTRVYLLDGQQRLVAAGIEGELYIAGASLARGYLGRAELTAERFVPDPFSATPGGRLYRTGDICRWRWDGALEFSGRCDEQVKVRGYRIELGEIETTLSQHPSVKESVVINYDDATNKSFLVAYLVPSKDGVLDEETLKTFVRQRLPEYMVPVKWIELESLPLTLNGKVDRRALPGPYATPAGNSNGSEGLRTPVEEVLADIWSRVLGIERIGPFDNFFELGGQSLLATRVISQIREIFHLELPVRYLFEAPTVAELADRLRVVQREENGWHLPPLESAPEDADIPLSFAQQRLWFTEQLAPGKDLFNNSVAVRFSGCLNIAALQQSFEQILRRHEVLRTAIVLKNGSAIQVVQPSAGLNLPVADLTALTESEQQSISLRLAREEAQRQFNPQQVPLLRLTLLQLGSHEHVGILTLHHLVTDNWSTDVLMRELGSLYQELSSGSPSGLPELAIQYKDYAYWQRQWLQGEALEEQLTYWKEQLADMPLVLKLPTDRPRPVKRSFRCASQPINFSREFSDNLIELSRHAGVTLFMTLLAAYKTLLYRYSGQASICVGTPIANRNWTRIEKLIGYFVNILVLRTDLSGNISFTQLLQRVRQVTLDAYAHQDLPFESLVEVLRPERSLAHAPVAQVTFTFQNAPMGALELADLTLTPVSIGSQTVVEYDLSLIMRDGPDGLDGALVYNTDLFDASSIKQLLNCFHKILEEVLNDPERLLLEIPLRKERTDEVPQRVSALEQYGVQQFNL
jgi:amino acid adenylation domain-containing protein